MVDFVERFFKLTLDNVYRFACSLLAAVALFSVNSAPSPIAGLTSLLDWLGIPSAWLTPVGDWVTNRQYAVGTVASFVLFLAIVAAARTRFSRAGSTALLAVVVLAQVELGHVVLIAAVVAPTGLWLARHLTIRTARRMSWTEPGWTASVAEWGANVSEALILAATYLFSPLGWLISQESHLPRGSRQNPLHIEQVAPRPPMRPGALPLRRN